MPDMIDARATDAYYPALNCRGAFLYITAAKRGIAQSGSAPALGAGCREFESLYPDQFQVCGRIDFHAPVAQLDRATAF